MRLDKAGEVKTGSKVAFISDFNNQTDEGLFPIYILETNGLKEVEIFGPINGDPKRFEWVKREELKLLAQ